MRIVQLKAENFMRLRAVTIEPSGNVVTIAGPNGAGKSSALQAIWSTLCWRAGAVDAPVRQGEEAAEVTLDLGEITVRRRWSAEGNMVLDVRRIVDGKAQRITAKPQDFLDALLGDLGFDPLAFCRMRPAEQRSQMAGLAGIDIAAYDARRASVYERRTEQNRAIKSLEARLGAIPVVDVPAEEISVVDLAKRQSEAHRQIEANRELARGLEKAIDDMQRLGDTITRLETELNRARRELADAERRRDTLRLKLDTTPRPDLDAITAEIGAAEVTNRQIRQQRERRALAEEVDAAKRMSQQMTGELVDIDEEQARAIAAAPLPVDGLGLGPDGLMFQGVPFSQASSAEQLRVSVAMAMALNPKVRVCLIRDGSLLDDNSLALLEQMADEKDFQVWLERVTDHAEEPAVVIEDGSVRTA